MLNFTKLAAQLPALSQYLTRETLANQQRLRAAQELWQLATTQQVEWVERLHAAATGLAFAPAVPLEPLDTCVTLPPAPPIHTVIATDGSQIAPSHHEAVYCYLINIGYVLLHYGSGRLPRLDSIPEVFYQAEDLYQCRQWGIRTEEWLSYRRTQLEATILAELATEWRSGGWDEPAIALLDGSLIYWFLEGLPAAAQAVILPPILEAWRACRKAQVPVLSYLSAGRSLDVMNFLRLGLCPHLTPDCQAHCNGQPDGAPCDKLKPLRDTTLMQTQLQPGQRGPLWRSTQPIQAQYDDQAVGFCYVHVGTEIARVEFPLWLADDRNWLDQSLGLLLAQVNKGYGYPVALAEAHNQAVVRAGDRARFFALIEEELLRSGLGQLLPSAKESRKRESIA
ncbi:MAG: DNA double-strand break repair nuclease NurA [Gloeomargarita sp. SKYBB_i_bin120]|nr:DNA double-strand break repair nuclease NurA [Gloeomargarita sp. SKYG98]MCS7293616.1 DNA double-strand break repair nuclease NurA [Gloeomargarita sp. SKYB120]MDW8179182.1 DNA double-strand break repair nuclease NurA [Gloeomargarita sp. SKYBB_i_bin120]